MYRLYANIVPFYIRSLSILTLESVRVLKPIPPPRMLPRDNCNQNHPKPASQPSRHKRQKQGKQKGPALCYQPNDGNFVSVHILPIKLILLGFPGGAVVKNLPANAGDTGSSPGLGRSHMPRSD